MQIEYEGFRVSCKVLMMQQKVSREIFLLPVCYFSLSPSSYTENTTHN